ncbi:DUF177 domain-containing protein [Aureimonas fodinaquatilis]|uniref:DUF177 domain-containing protein n=1 Tax=Aureimonas fodinaquatilis TaxID=2565783 RepID=A0A5B0DXP2_9HYPH|nr:DUF177 domain-containing protein [Aureimonas fodinaquatilis]KAA0970655.1 DUF177 domain-containing protein [Aureimonas fodinaquatilis]
MQDRKQTADDCVLDFDVVISRLPKSGLDLGFKASDQELIRLAEFLGVLTVEEMSAELTVMPWRRDGVSVKGVMKARLQQASVLTLDPIPESINERVDLVFVPDGSRLARIAPEHDGELHLDPEGDEIPESFSGDRINLGASLQELLALAINPYPREETATFNEYSTDNTVQEKEPSPFASLQGWRKDSSENSN